MSRRFSLWSKRRRVPIGWVGSGGVAEICEGNPFFATGETPVVPVVRRMQRGALMSGLEKPPRGRRLCPRRRTVDRAAVRADGDYLWKLALRRKVAGNVLIVGGHGSEFFAWAFMRIEHDNRLPSMFLEIMERCYEIGIARDKHDAVEDLFHVVYEHLRCDVHIRTFLFGLPHDRSRNLFAGFAGLYRLNPSMYTMVFFIHVTPKGKSRTFARLCTALPKLSGRLSTHQGVRCALYQIPPRGARGSCAKKFSVLADDRHVSSCR